MSFRDELVITAADLSGEDLADGLRSWADGSYATEAAVELLIGHRSWLYRGEFLALVWVTDDLCGFDVDDLAGLAATVPASRSELAVLNLVLSFLGVPSTDSLAELIVGLDLDNTALVLEAVACSAGWHKRYHEHLTTGRFLPTPNQGDDR